MSSLTRSMTSRFEKGPGGKIIGFVTCPECEANKKEKHLRIIREATRSWPLFNINRHFINHLRSSTSSTIIQKRRPEDSFATSTKRFRENDTTNTSSLIEPPSGTTIGNVIEVVDESIIQELNAEPIDSNDKELQIPNLVDEHDVSVIGIIV